jgi:membrane carboxypeptidase/penicillin-binding protein PbpC
LISIHTKIFSRRILYAPYTLTQQLAENAYLTLDQTLERKAKEIFMAIEIEKKYDKDQILTMYLNTSNVASSYSTHNRPGNPFDIEAVVFVKITILR